jgi:antitoxin ChpS
MKVRRQGGARVVTLPAALLERVGAQVGTPLALEVRDGVIVATPVREARGPGRRYTLAELLDGVEHLQDYRSDTAGALDGPAVGDELG